MNADETPIEEADRRWADGDRALAIRILHNSGTGAADLLRWVRGKGLDVDAARAEIRDSGIDWS